MGYFLCGGLGPVVIVVVIVVVVVNKVSCKTAVKELVWSWFRAGSELYVCIQTKVPTYLPLRETRIQPLPDLIPGTNARSAPIVLFKARDGASFLHHAQHIMYQTYMSCTSRSISCFPLAFFPKPGQMERIHRNTKAAAKEEEEEVKKRGNSARLLERSKYQIHVPANRCLPPPSAKRP